MWLINADLLVGAKILGGILLLVWVYIEISQYFSCLQNKIDALYIEKPKIMYGSDLLVFAVFIALKFPFYGFSAITSAFIMFFTLGPVNTIQRLHDKGEVDKKHKDNIQFVEACKDSTKSF